MNKIHRTVWNEARQCFVVASETAKAKGKASSSRAGVVPAVAAALLALGGGQAFATVACGVLPGAATTVISSATAGPCTLSGGSVLSVEQSGSITGAENGVLVPGGGVTGTRVTNSGYILGSTNGVWLDPFNGVGQVDSLVNASTGTITGTSDYGLRSFGTSTKINDISNAGTIQGGINAISIYSANMTGSVVNAATGLIAGTLTNSMGINITNGSRLVSLNNAGTVTGRTGGIAVSISQTTLSGGITNSGFINGYYGLYASGQTGGVINSGRMEGTGVANEGAGLHLDGTMTGSVINQGASAVILGGATGLQLSSFRMISGSITNGGLIQGQAANGFGVSMTTLTGSPGFTNSGTILGATALNSNAATVLPAIQNNAGALISGKLSLLSTTTLSNNGTLSLPTATQSTMAGSYTQGSTGVFRTGVTSGSLFGKLRVSGTATLPASAQFDVVTGNASTCGGITVGTTLVGVISAATLTWDNTYAVTDDCTNINFTAVRSGQLVNLVAVAEGPSSWTVTGASGGNGTVSCVSPVVNNGYATCTGTASGGYTLNSATGCGNATVSGTTITAGPVTAACTVTGTFARNTYVVTGASGGHGTVSCTTPVAHGGTATCTGTASGGYTLNSATGCGNATVSGTTITAGPVTAACTVTGTFAQNNYAITATASPTAGGTVTCTPSSVTYGNSSTCTGSANPGYTFSTFSGDCTGPTCVLTNITAAKSVTANFTANPVNGACGSAAGLPSAIVPNANLCATGSTPGLVSAAGGGYSWSCAGTGNGAQPAQCTAPGTTVSGSTARTTFELISGTGCVVRRAGVQAPPAGGPGNNVQMPYGVLDFKLEECTAGIARVRMTYSASIEGMQFYKFVNANWVQLTTVGALTDGRDGEVVISGNTATFNIRDNGAYDADITPGVIVDPGGPGFAPTTTAPIPTLSEWGLIFLSSLMAMFGIRQVRRGKQRS